MLNTYQAGETVRITAAVTDVSGDPVAPTTVTLAIKKPIGTLDLNEVAMTTEVIGIYYTDYTIADIIGEYKLSVKATGSSGRVTIASDSFSVESAL